MTNKLLDKLQKLYALTRLGDHELNDEARLNEARTAAWALIKTARENDVTIKFIVPKPKAPPAPEPPPRPTTQGTYNNPWGERARTYSRANDFKVDFGVGFDPGGGFGNIHDFINHMQEEMRRQRESIPKERAEPRKGIEYCDVCGRPLFTTSFRTCPDCRKNEASEDHFARQDPWYWERVGAREPHAAGKAPNGAIAILTKFQARCVCCNHGVGIGERAWWRQGVGVSHEKCGWAGLGSP